MCKSRRNHFGSVGSCPRALPSPLLARRCDHLANDVHRKADALAWLASVETDIHRGAWVDPAGAS